MDVITNFENEIKQEIHPAMRMPTHERFKRSREKQSLLLNFLGSGEIWTTLDVISHLIEGSEQNARRLVQRMVKDSVIKVDKVPHLGGQLKLYGITSYGLRVANNPHPCCRPFEIGRTHPDYVQHHLDCQYVRLVTERNTPDISWVPEKMLVASIPAKERKGRKFPDALMIYTKRNERVGIEVERNVKYQENMRNALAGHVHAFMQKEYDRVYYFSDHRESLKRSMYSIRFVKLANGENIDMEDGWFDRFIFGSLSDYKEILVSQPPSSYQVSPPHTA